MVRYGSNVAAAGRRYGVRGSLGKTIWPGLKNIIRSGVCSHCSKSFYLGLNYCGSLRVLLSLSGIKQAVVGGSIGYAYGHSKYCQDDHNFYYGVTAGI